MQWRKAAEVAQGIGIAFSREPLPNSYFEAITTSKDDAEDLAAQDELKRMQQAADAKRSSGDSLAFWG